MMIDIAPLYCECLAMMTLEELEKTEKFMQKGKNKAAWKILEAIRSEKIKRMQKND